MELQQILKDTPEKNEHLCVYKHDNGLIQNILLRDTDATSLTDEQLDQLARKTLEEK